MKQKRIITAAALAAALALSLSAFPMTAEAHGAEANSAEANSAETHGAETHGAEANESYVNEAQVRETAAHEVASLARTGAETSGSRPSRAAQAAQEILSSARAVQASYYSIPSGAYPIRVVINGRSVLEGAVYNLNGITYVPLAAFADWVGTFSHGYDKYSASATLEGENLSLRARAGDLYVVANGRYFYTSQPVMLHGGRIYVPILAATKALNAHVRWSAEDACFYVGSGDSRLLRSADAVYDADSVFWLARIITAESGGETLRGKIAVGNVVLNRMRSPSYPNTIYGVIFDRKYGVQFSPTVNGTIYNNPTAESIIAAKICLEGYSLSEDILYFVNPTLVPGSWIEKNRPFAFKIGNHAFFK